MLVFINQFFRGVFTSAISIFEISQILKNKEAMYSYVQIIVLNILLFLGYQFLTQLGNLVHDITVNTYLISLYYLFNVLNNVMIYIPIYIICYIISLDKLCNLFNNINSLNKNDDKFQESLNSRLYFTLVSTLLYLIIKGVIYIPVFGYYLSFLFTSYSYGFFCLEYSCYYKNISNMQKLAIIENNPYFFIGYGIIYALFVQYLHYINLSLFFVILFPLGVIKLAKTNIYTLTSTNYNSKIFILPIIIVNLLLSIIDSYTFRKPRT